MFGITQIQKKVFFILVVLMTLNIQIKQAGAATASSASSLIPLKDFFRNPTSRGHALSPDGRKIAYLKAWESRMNIFVKTIGKDDEKQVTSNKDRDINDFSWKGNSHILYSKDFGGDENFHLFNVDIIHGTEKDTTPFEKTRVDVVDFLTEVNDHDVLISHNQRNAELFDVYRLNVETGKMKLVYKNPGDVTGYLTDHLGRLRVASRNVGTDTEILYRENEQAAFKPIMKFDYTRSFSPIAFTVDNKNLYITSNLGRDKESLIEFDPRAKKETKLIYQNPEYDISTMGYSSPLVFSEKRKKLLEVNYLTWKLQHAFFDSEYEKMLNLVIEQFPQANVAVLSKSKDETKYTVVVSSDRMRGQVYLVDATSQKIELLTELAPWLKATELAEMKPIQYTSRDGMTISGYLTLPRGKEIKNLPVIVNPHGGPWARDFWRFNPEVQFLASRGYAILQMNFRGSTGYGRRHFTASFKQWGLKMQDDITDGAQWLIDMGIANPKKICIYGGSYGGYATLMGLVKTPDLYACGVDYVGVSNLFTFLKTIPPYWKLEMEKMSVMLGDPVRDEAQFKMTSPALNVDQIKAPLFIAQGAKDPRVNKAESDQIVEALKKKGIEVPYLVKDDEGHGFHNEENRFDFYTAMEKFLAQHLK